MELLYLLEKIRNPVFDFFFSLITHIGEETFFLVIAIVFFWCVNKREGLYILMSGLMGTVVNQFLKIICKVPRPWVIDPKFTIVESARAEATGYSFPSGHTQNVASTFGSVAAAKRKRWVTVSCIVIIALVGISRMYLGVHTPWDVLASLAIAAMIIIALHPVFKDEESFKKYFPLLLGICTALSLCFLVFVNVVGEEGYNLHNLESARKNAATLFGCMTGLCIGYPIDRRWTDFDTKAKWYSQLIKLFLGLGVILLIKSTLQKPLELLIGLVFPEPTYIARAVRYAIIVLFAGAVWPLTFKFFGKLKIGFMEKLTEKMRKRLKKSDTPAD